MSDPIAEAAEALNAAPAIEPVQGSGVIVNGVELPASAVSGTTVTLASAPGADVGITSNVVPVTGNVLLNATPASEAGTAAAGESLQSLPASMTSTSLAPSSADVQDAPVEPSRESLLMRMHAAIDELEAKIATGVHVFAHEVAALREHIAKVL